MTLKPLNASPKHTRHADDLDRHSSIIGAASSLHLTYGPRLDSHTDSMTSSNDIHFTWLNSAFSPPNPARLQ